ncbi:Uncharacterized protein OS=Beggiatoa sp. PS GN=BGP_1013 PE=4 SV=1 [Gemmata massiliana]|uniref:Uncharacterized protein n=1 Tax=Gemmata massiliana TaxID=1210884 RepID=A0A6P2CV37_9BACT|nr:hypothetical protein [Gemmata massiliana]VTR91564.1 Uncharacterized protein OS=Beggiatoa sp. PS GN=BGP_1013 PE=4 SV=1 [Gemmata massiliana]
MKMPIRRDPILREGFTEFYPYCYMLMGADTAIEAAQLFESTPGARGRNFHYATAVLFSAFAVEAVVNHIGLDKIANWAVDDNGRKLGGWRKKLDAVAALNGHTPDFSTAPFKTIDEAFKFRDKMAHGKTWVAEQCFLDTGAGQEHILPDWLQPFLNETRATEVIADARNVVQTLLVWSGYAALDLHRMGSGEYYENTKPNAGPRAPVWKIKNS